MEKEQVTRNSNVFILYAKLLLEYLTITISLLLADKKGDILFVILDKVSHVTEIRKLIHAVMLVPAMCAHMMTEAIWDSPATNNKQVTEELSNQSLIQETGFD